MSALTTYNYDKQIKSYLVQFAAIFADLKVEVGKSSDKDERLISVPIKSASVDRVVGAIIGENTQNKPIRLPLMAFHLASVDNAPELRKGVGVTRRNTYVPTGGLVPDDISVVTQRMPVPYRATFELSLWVSNQNQHYQIIEQILTLFDPSIQIQNSDEIFDWARMTTVELVDIRFDENLPIGNERRVIQSTLVFTAPIYLSLPSTVRKNIIESIQMRIGVVSTSVETSLEALEDLDGQNIVYDTIFKTSDLDIT